MTTYTFRPLPTTQYVSWNDPAVWVGGVVPNSPDADVVFPTTTNTSTGVPYASFVIIKAGEAEAVRSVQLANNHLTVPGSLTVSGALAVEAGGEINLQGGSVSAGSITNRGIDIQGNGTLTAASIDNEATIQANITYPPLVINAPVSGEGTLEIEAGSNYYMRNRQYLNIASLELNGAVAATQDVNFGNEVGKLILDQPSSFAGTIAPVGYGNQIVLKGVSRDAITGTAYTGDVSGGMLTLQEASGPLALRFAGNLSAASFALTAGNQTLPTDPPSLVITVSGPAAQPLTAAGTVSAEIGLIYETVLGRAADAGGLAHYVEQATRQGVTLADEAANMAGSAEATGRYGSQTDSQFVTQLFANAYGSEATSADNVGLANALVGELGRGSLTRGEVAVGVALGQQHRQIAGVDLSDGLIIPNLTGTVTADPTSPAGVAELIALTLLGHPLDGLDLQADASLIAGGMTPARLAFGFIDDVTLMEPDDDFIARVYAHSFGRVPDADGLAHYHSLIANASYNGTPRAAIAADIALSPEHVANVRDALDQGLHVPDPTTSGLARLYETVLGRAPDLFGLTAERHRLDQGQTLTDRAASMLASPEYAARYGTPSDQTFITELYANALGRAPEGPGLDTPGGQNSPGGLNTYLAELAGGTTRAAVALEIASSPEATDHLAPQIENGFVTT